MSNKIDIADTISINRTAQIEFEPVLPSEYRQFIRLLQGAFSVAVYKEFGSVNAIPSVESILQSIHAKGAETLHILADGKRIGGAVILINKRTHYNVLDLFFISPAYHNLRLGQKVWKEIEQRYPDTKVWELITPYFEKRNIHFYINRCGFHIVEFFNSRHVDRNMPPPTDKNGNPLPGWNTYFRFEKDMNSLSRRAGAACYQAGGQNLHHRGYLS